MREIARSAHSQCADELTLTQGCACNLTRVHLENNVEHVVLQEISKVLEEHGGIGAVNVAMVACDGDLTVIKMSVLLLGKSVSCVFQKVSVTASGKHFSFGFL